MKQYREKFIQHFPTLLAELTKRELFSSCLKHNSEHLKEVSVELLNLPYMQSRVLSLPLLPFAVGC